MENLIYLPIAIGILGGGFLACWSSRPIVLRIGNRVGSPRLVAWCAAIGALLMAAPALYFAFVIGANLGGAMAEAVSFNKSLGHAAVSAGLILGILVTFGGGIAVGIVGGSLSGSLLLRAIALVRSGKPSGGTR